jgi:peroxiredoxin
VVSYTTTCNKDQQGNLIPTPVGLWRDTFYVREGESYTIRSRFQDYSGDSVLHCHILDHEDQGMMMRIRLIDPNLPPVPGKGALSLLDESKPAPRLKLPDTNGTNHELADLTGRMVVLVFFRGAQCFHCGEQLQDLVREARGKLGNDVEIMAISSRKIAEPALALKALGVGGADTFQLLVDESHRAFRDFGCFDGQPQHGLFLIDRDGVIRARHVGESPFDDTKEVIRRVRETAAMGDKLSR